MESLVLHDCLLSDQGLINIGVHHERLTRISFTGCKNITKAGFSNFLRRKLRLQILCVRNCYWFSDESLKELETSCPRLLELNIDYLAVSIQALDQFRGRRPGVSVFKWKRWEVLREPIWALSSQAR